MRHEKNIPKLILSVEAIAIPISVVMIWSDHPFFLYLLTLSFLAIIPVWINTMYIADTINFTFKGYAVYTPSEPEPSVFYKERGKGKIEFYTSPESDEKGRFLLVHVPSNTVWDNVVPSWAVGRKSDIVVRVKKELSWDKSIRFGS